MEFVVVFLVLAAVFCGIMALRQSQKRKRADDTPAGNIGSQLRDPSDTSALHKKAREALSQNLLPNEPIKVIIYGLSDSAIIGTDRRVFVFKQGITAGVLFGVKFTSWDYRNLSGVQIEKGITSGFVALQGPGILATDGNVWDLGDSKFSVWNIPSAITIGQIHLAQASEGVAILRKLISQYQQPQHLSDLETLSNLRDKGIITEEEFQKKKRQILGI